MPYDFWFSCLYDIPAATHLRRSFCRLRFIQLYITIDIVHNETPTTIRPLQHSRTIPWHLPRKHCLLYGRDDCEPRHARQAMQDLIACTTSNIATVAPFPRRNQEEPRAGTRCCCVQMHPISVAIVCPAEVRNDAGR